MCHLQTLGHETNRHQGAKILEVCQEDGCLESIFYPFNSREDLSIHVVTQPGIYRVNLQEVAIESKDLELPCEPIVADIGSLC